ncbi:MAG: PAS domain S-box protein [Gammaproteobacteria bacterium]
MNDLNDNTEFSVLVIRINTADTRYSRSIVVSTNLQAARLLGYQVEALIGQPLEALFSPSAWPSLVAAIKLALNTKSAGHFESEIITKTQDIQPIFLWISPLYANNHSYRDCIFSLQAITPGNELPVMRRVIEQSASAMMITDRSGRIEYVNPKFSELTGYSANELLGQSPRILQSGKMSHAFYQNMWNSLITTGEWHGEIQNKYKNGSNYWVNESISAIKDTTGKITHFLAVEEDITQRKETASALLESEERFRQMAQLSGEWLWEQDSKGYYLYSSIAVEQILGFGQKQIIGKHYTELLTPQDKESQTVVSSSQQAFYGLVNHYQHKDGHQIVTESTGLPILDDQGKLLKWRGVDRDITARMQYQKALIDSEKRTRLIIESSINAIVLMDSNGIITDWNRQAENMFGWSASEAIGQRLDELIIPERLHAAHRQGLRVFLESGVGPVLNQQLEHVAKRRSGHEFPVELSVSPLKVGNSYIFSGFIHDISGRKAAEEQIRQAQVNLAITQNEIKIAQNIQASLLPSSSIATSCFEITGFCLPADKIGGDYYDYFFRNENLLDIVIADVSGHSIGPALFMVETRSALRAQNDRSENPAKTISRLNDFLFSDLDHADYFITLFYMQVDIAGRRLTYTNAGHPPPLLFNRHRTEFTALDAEGLILGIQQNVVFEKKTLMLEPGDTILFYTDGLIEAESPDLEFFGLQRVKTALRKSAGETPDAIVKALMEELRLFRKTAKFDDDITLMIFQWR